MKSLVVGLFTVLAVCSMSFGDIVRVYKTSDPGGMDAGIRLVNFGNKGGSSAFRIGKPWNQGLGVFDFGNEAAMGSQLLADLLHENPAWTSISLAMVADAEHPLGHVIVKFGVVTQAADPLKQLQVGQFMSKTAWAEGNGTDADTNYSSSILAVTGTKAQAISGGVGDVAWQQVLGTDLADFNGLTTVYQAGGTPNFLGGNQYTMITLAQGVWRPYVAGPIGGYVAGPGIVTRDFNNPDGNIGNANLQIYSNNQNSSVAPMLEISVVPEPATMAVLLVGGVAALIRRRR